MTAELIYRYALLFIAIHELLYWVYFWQVKEYRLDRFRGSFDTAHDIYKALFQSINLRRWYRPKITTRAFVIFVLGTILFLAFFVVINATYAVFSIALPPIATAIGVFISHPFFWLIKKAIIIRARRRMKKFRGTVIGITGSVGKTSTKELLAHVLASSFTVEKTKGNDNSEIGVAMAALRVPLDTKFFVVEMGAYRRGEIKAICDIVHPKIGIITAIGDQHLSMFGSLENLRKAKFELIDALPPGGLKMVVGEDFYISEATNIVVEKENISFTYKKEKFTVPLLGSERIANLLAVIKVGEYLRIPLKQITHALSLVSPELFYPKLYPAKHGGMIIDDTHNSSRESFLAAIDYLSVWDGYVKVVVTPGIIELGSRAREDHQNIGRSLAPIDRVLVTNPNFFEELNTNKNAHLVTDHYALIGKVEDVLTQKTVVLFEGRTPKAIVDSLREH